MTVKNLLDIVNEHVRDFNLAEYYDDTGKRNRVPGPALVDYLIDRTTLTYEALDSDHAPDNDAELLEALASDLGHAQWQIEEISDKLRDRLTSNAV